MEKLTLLFETIIADAYAWARYIGFHAEQLYMQLRVCVCIYAAIPFHRVLIQSSCVGS